MEKPIELLLKNKDIKISYCMCSANEPWTRAWDGATSKVVQCLKSTGMRKNGENTLNI